MEHFDGTPTQKTEHFIPTLLLDVLLQLEATRTTDEVWNVLVNLAKRLGLGIVDYVYAADFPDCEQAQFIRTTFDSRSCDAMRQLSHICHLSNFRTHGVHYLTPIMIGPAYLKEMDTISPETRHNVLQIGKMGLNAGVAFPLRMGHPGQAALLAFGGPQDRDGFDALITAHGWTLHAAALTAHARYTELFKLEFIQRTELTAKQQEMIRLVGQGLMDKQIAHQLGISFSAVRQRLSAVQQKTGTQNRADLAALAARVGLVPDPLLRAHADDLAAFLANPGSKAKAALRQAPLAYGPVAG